MAGDLAKPTALHLPNLVIVGVAKSGTTSLFNYLGQHPDVCTADRKELRYFMPLRYGEALEPIDSYAAHFTHCGPRRYAVEATPGYFYGGRTLARGLRETCSGSRALLSLRAPEDRCWSWFRFVKSRTRIPKEMGFEEYLDRCEDLHAAGTDGDPDNQEYWGLGAGCYARWLDDWMQEFGERLRIVFFDNVVADPSATMKGICDWLAIDDAIVDSFQFDVDNKTEQYRHRGFQKVAVSINRRGERVFQRHRSTKRLLRSAYYSVNKSAEELTLPQSSRERLQDFYRPHTAELQQQLATVELRLPPGWLHSS